ncbi:serine/threonine protein phosphatase 2A 55 kDa regulatory subunit B alpha isoform-like [Gossypium raimondii]|uniref:serine/threonine protein phosphatase 2A 55 kDa regulatory subunit B alpha isoform-like n=1 Tax=Gossypium raimondii TaxID=29730 RepID=UPI00227C537D|nr:serine/threonine protein phosphatase 2A 55 kDa regulatory subunit B alpha isoform-like [Gossypium raimondii]
MVMFKLLERRYTDGLSISVSLIIPSDGETFIPADDLRINLWNLEISNQSFNIVDVKPANMEDLTEVITSAEFHPTHCNMLAYSSSKGSICLIDLRQSAFCDPHAKLQAFYRF